MILGEEVEVTTFIEEPLGEELVPQETDSQKAIAVEKENSSQEVVTEEVGEASMEIASPPNEFEGKEVLVAQEFYPGGSKKLEYTYYEVDGKRFYHGLFTKWYENGKIIIQGTYRDGKKDGLWEEYLRNGVLKSEGTYVNGLKKGKWTIYYESGNKHWEGNYHQNEKEGLWIEYANIQGDKKFAEVEYRAGKEVPGS